MVFRPSPTRVFQSTPSAWRETTLREKKILALIISIHSLRVEGDGLHILADTRVKHFNPLPPRGGRLPYERFCGTYIMISIHSLRVEGDFNRIAACEIVVISIHSLRVEGDIKRLDHSERQRISIHSLRVEGDPGNMCYNINKIRFQSTPSAWRETVYRRQKRQRTSISIHSLRVEGDDKAYKPSFASGYFNPLPPRGGRRP